MSEKGGSDMKADGGRRTADSRRGLYGKYVIQKADGGEMDPDAVYFTLRADTDRHARAAIRAYIESCREEQPELASDLESLLERIESR